LSKCKTGQSVMFIFICILSCIFNKYKHFCPVLVLHSGKMWLKLLEHIRLNCKHDCERIHSHINFYFWMVYFHLRYNIKMRELICLNFMNIVQYSLKFIVVNIMCWNVVSQPTWTCTITYASSIIRNISHVPKTDASR
jgi:hypothetical protein